MRVRPQKRDQPRVTQHQHEMTQINGVELAQRAVIDRPARRQVRRGRRGHEDGPGGLRPRLSGSKGKSRRSSGPVSLGCTAKYSMLRCSIYWCRRVYVNPASGRHHDQDDPHGTPRRAQQGSALADPHLCRPFDGGEVERALPHQPGARSDRPRRSPSICRPRPATTATIALATGEVGKVGVPISHLGDMRTLFDGIPLDRMNTSMTINAPAAWLLVALHRARRERRASSAPSCRARRRTTSSRNISRAAPTSSRPSRRCG